MMTSDKDDLHVDTEVSESTDAPQPPRRITPTQLFVLVLVVVLGGMLWHVHARVDPSLIYHGDLVELPSQDSFLIVPLFSRTTEFFGSFLARPGGVAEWMGAYLTQCFAFPYVGTAILGVLGLMVFLLTNRIVTQVIGRPARYAGFFPLVLLVLVWSRYLFRVGDCVGLCLALLACVGYLRMSRPASRGIALVAGTMVLYYLLGAPGLLFACICSVAEFVRVERWWLGVVGLLVAGVAPLVIGVVALGATLNDAYLRMFGGYSHGFRASVGMSDPVRVWTWSGIYGVCVVLVVLAGLCARFGHRSEQTSEGREDKVSALTGGIVVVILLASLGVLFLGFDTDARSILRIHRFALEGQWARLLYETYEHPPEEYSVQSVREINRALVETGQLGSRMFNYPQQKESLLASMTSSRQSVVECYTFMELGMINQAENLGAELLTTYGAHPTLLKLMGQVFIVKGEPKGARVFLNRLSQDVVYGSWATETLENLDIDPMLLDDPEITHYRSLQQRRENLDQTYSGVLFGLVREDPRKYRKAFEYLMAVSMVDRPTDLAELAGHVRRVGILMQEFIPVMGYAVLPEHYSEVRVLHIRMLGQDLMLDYPIPSGTESRFGRCYRVIREHWDDPETMDQLLAKQMPGSYFRYFHTGRSGE